MENQTILITGTNGFIANEVIQFLKKKNFNVISTSRYKNIRSIFIDFNITVKKNVNIPKFDFLIHLAYARRSSFADEKYVNYEYSKFLFRLAKKNKAKIIYVSSQSSAKNSLSKYGKIKFHIEKLAKQYESLIIRPGLVYKKNTYDGLYGQINLIIKKYPLVFLPSGLNKKIYLCNIESLLEKIYLLITTKENFKLNIINDNESYTLKTLIKKIITENRKYIILIPVNYRILFYLLKIIEIFKIDLKFKADNLLSLKK